MEPEVENYLANLEKELEAERSERQKLQKEYGQASMFGGNNTENLVQQQLDLNEELERIDHLLRGHIIKRDQAGNEYWAEPDDERFKLFSEFGVQEIMKIVQFYLNRNTLLSNYTIEDINIKMKDLGDDIADLIFMKYEELFYEPSLNYCIKIYTQKLDEKKRILRLTYELLGKNISEEEFKDQFRKVEMTSEKIEDEIAKIKYDIYKSKLKSYSIIVRVLIDTIHSSYLRALNGGERDSLRKVMHVSQNQPLISQTDFGAIQPQRKFNLLNPFSWGR